MQTQLIPVKNKVKKQPYIKMYMSLFSSERPSRWSHYTDEIICKGMESKMQALMSFEIFLMQTFCNL